MYRVFSGGLAAAVVVCTAAAQEFSTSVFESEDALREAFLSGEIDLDQYLGLREMLQLGIDSTEAEAYDLVPNAPGFPEEKPPDAATISPTSSAPITSLERDQRQAFVSPRSRPWVRLRHTQPLETGRSAEYHARIGGRVHPRWRAVLAIGRDSDGADRVTARSVGYGSGESWLRDAALGTYSRRIGLGAVFGYRGRVLERSPDEAESVLFPDYGGSNGAYFRAAPGVVRAEAAVSVHRNQTHCLQAAAMALGLRARPVAPMLVAAVGMVRNRETGRLVSDYKLGLNTALSFGGGVSVLEVVWQAGEREGFGAALIEGRHRFRDAEVRFAGWRYGDCYLDLAGGSKAAAMSRTTRLEDVDLEFSEKRSGQRGGLVKTLLTLGDHWQLAGSVLHAERFRDRNTDLLQALVWETKPGREIRLDHLWRDRHRPDASDAVRTSHHRTRLELRDCGRRHRLRAFVAYDSRDTASGWIAFFANYRTEIDYGGQVEFYADFSRIDPNALSLQRFYGFVRVGLAVTRSFRLSTKVTHTYSRSATTCHSGSIIVELEVSP